MADHTPVGGERATFRPVFALGLLYWALFFFFFAILMAAPDLIAGYRALPSGNAPLTPEELEHARDITRQALGGRLLYAVAAATLTSGLAIWRGVLPGLRNRGPG